MKVYKEFNHKEKTIMLQVVKVKRTEYLLAPDGTVHYKKPGLPVVTTQSIIDSVKEAAQ